jgi:hypothetical protein
MAAPFRDGGGHCRFPGGLPEIPVLTDLTRLFTDAFVQSVHRSAFENAFNSAQCRRCSVWKA